MREIRWGVGVVLAVLCSPGVSLAQSSLSLVDQLREIDLILNAPLTRPADIPESADAATRKDHDLQMKAYDGYVKVAAFKIDPWANTPKVEDITAAFAGLQNVQLGPSQGATEGTSFFPEAAVINGLTDFVVNRAKDEVSVTFLIDLRDRLSRDALLKLLFKQTVIVIGQLEASSAKQMLPQLRAAVIADVRAIPQTLLSQDAAIDALWTDIDAHLQDPGEKMKLKNAIQVLKDNRAAIYLLSKALQDMVNGVPAMTTLAGYADLTPTDLPEQREVRYALITVGTVAREYRWAPIQTKQMLTDPVERTRFLALLSRDLRQSQAGGAACPTPVVSNDACDVQQWAVRARNVEVKLNDVLAAIDVTVHAVETLRGSLSDADTTKSEAFGDVANAALQILAAARPFATGNDGLTKQWDGLSAKITHVNKLQVSIVGRDYVTAINEANLILTDFDVTISLPSSVLKPLAFAAALASAKTSEDVTAAIETAAVPVLSFRVKRTRTPGERNTWVGVNAYVGGSIGLEHVSSASSTSVGFGGLTVPFGVEVGWPLPSGHGVDSLSIFVPVIDVGTVASFRFKSADVDQQPALTFSQLVAPGAFAVFGLTQKYPVSVGVGAQFVPKLRRPAGGSDSLFDAIRYGAFVAIDVPVFRF